MDDLQKLLSKVKENVDKARQVVWFKRIVEALKVLDLTQKKIIQSLDSVKTSIDQIASKKIDWPDKFNVTVDNQIEIPKEVKVSNLNDIPKSQFDFPESFRVSNLRDISFPKIVIPSKVRVENLGDINFPEFPEFPEFPSEIKIKNFQDFNWPTDPDKPISVRLSNGKEFYEAILSYVGGGGGSNVKQYVDGENTPTHPIGNALVFKEDGTNSWNVVRSNNGLPIQGNVNAQITSPIGSQVAGQSVSVVLASNHDPVVTQPTGGSLTDGLQKTKIVNSGGDVVDFNQNGNGQIEVQVTAEYFINDKDDSSNPVYYGFTDIDENWYIMEKNVSLNTYRYVKGSGSYTSAWSNRASLTYDYYHNVF